jgi:hypothetical protein
LKLYSAHLDIKRFNILKDRKLERSKFLDDRLKRGESIDIENFDLIDFNINDDSNLKVDEYGEIEFNNSIELLVEPRREMKKMLKC